MGKLTDDILQWTLDINGKPAIKELGIVEQETNTLKTANKDLRVEMQKLEVQGKKNSKEYNELNKQMGKNKETIAQNEKRMEALRKEIGLNSLSTSQLSKRYNELNQQFRRTTPGTPEWKKLRTELTQVKGRMNELSISTSKANGVFGSLKSLLPIIGFAALAAGAKQLISRIIDVRAEFQRYEAVLSTALGSQTEARIEMNNLKELAAQTPFSINELTSAYVKLVNQGFKPTNEQMIAMGDLASSTGKGFDQLTEAIIDAQTGEFERLKEFGVRAKKEGDKVTFTFKGVETQVDFTNQAIQDYVIGLGQTEGVSGSMAKISETLGGQISNLGDNWTQLLDNLGNRSGGVFYTVINWLNKLVSGLSLASKSVEQIKLEVSDASWVATLKADQEEIDKIGTLFTKTLEIQNAAAKKRLETGIKNIDQLELEKEVLGEVQSQAIKLTEAEKEQIKKDIEQNEARIAEAVRYMAKKEEVKNQTVNLTKEEISAQKKLADERQKILENIQKLEDEYHLNKLDKDDQELQKVVDKWNKEIEAARAAGVELSKIREAEELRDQEYFDTLKKQNEDYFNTLVEQLEKEVNADAKYIEDALKLEDDKNQELRKKRQEDTENHIKQLENLQGKTQEYTEFVGGLLASALEDGKITQQEALKILTISLLKALKNTIIASITSATAQSFAQADSVATFGATGAIRAGILVGLIEAAYQGVESLLTKNIGQAAKGRYPVIGADDGRLYNADYYGPVSKSGIINHGRPTLINEQGGEIILTKSHSDRLMLNPRLYSEVMALRTPQRAEGKYNTTAQTTKSADTDYMLRVIQANTDTMRQLIAATSNLKAKVLLSDVEDAQSDMDSIRKYASGN